MIKDNKKMILFIKKHIVKILIAIGIISVVLFIVYTQLNNIPTKNTWAAFIGFILFYAPVLTGAWIASEKMKEKRKTFSIVIKGIIIFYCISLVGSFIAFLITL